MQASNSTEISTVENISTSNARPRFNGRTRFRADRALKGLKSIDESVYVDPSVPYGQFQNDRSRRGNRIAAALKMRRVRAVTRTDSRVDEQISSRIAESPSFEEFNVNAERERISEILEAATRQQYPPDTEVNQDTQEITKSETEFAEKEIELRSGDDSPAGEQHFRDAASHSATDFQQKSVLDKSSVDQDPTVNLEAVPSDQIAKKLTGDETLQIVTSQLQNRQLPHKGILDSSPIIPDPLNRPAHSRRDNVIVLQAKPVERVNFNSTQQVSQNQLEIGPPPVVPVSSLRAGSQMQTGIPSQSAAYDEVQQALRLPTYSFRPLPEMQEVTSSPEGIPLVKMFDATSDRNNLSPPLVDHHPPALLECSSPNETGTVPSQILRLHAIPGNGQSTFSRASSSARIRFLQPSYEIRRPAESEFQQNDQIEEIRAPLPDKLNSRPIFDYDRIHTAIRGTSETSNDAASPAIIIER